jgi:Uma2 family endonuclease
MVQQLQPDTAPDIIYPDSDGQPMADNTKQFRWIVTIKENLEILFASRNDVFVAGDLLWYPIKGSDTCQAPDVLVVFGTPKGDRGSYKQWLEENIPVQVVFEILSPSNSLKDMAKKFQFYQNYGVEEYYVYDPNKIDLNGWLRNGDTLQVIEEISGWVSPLLGIRFEVTFDSLEIYRPDGQKFLTSVELDQLREQECLEKEAALNQLEDERLEKETALNQLGEERLEKEAALNQLEEERQRYQDLLKRMQERGITLEDL